MYKTYIGLYLYISNTYISIIYLVYTKISCLEKLGSMISMTHIYWVLLPIVFDNDEIIIIKQYIFV